MFTNVLYVSTSLHRLGHLSDLDILRTAEFRNPRFGLTGCLLRGSDWFAQSLEGYEPDVKRIFEGILRDTRHTVDTVWWSADQEERMFPAWSMALAHVRGDERWLHGILMDDLVPISEKNRRMKDAINRFGKTTDQLPDPEIVRPAPSMRQSRI